VATRQVVLVVEIWVTLQATTHLGLVSDGPKRDLCKRDFYKGDFSPLTECRILNTSFYSFNCTFSQEKKLAPSHYTLTFHALKNSGIQAGERRCANPRKAFPFSQL
jgi:hypothetical protein